MVTTEVSTNEQLKEELRIEGVTELTVLNYFVNLNSGEFEATAKLFSEDGVMHPPFESGILGTEAIATYLKQEAQDIRAYPEKGIVENLGENQIQIQVIGKVQTSWCGVNVLWLFVLNKRRQIVEAKIKLLASPQELLSLRPPER